MKTFSPILIFFFGAPLIIFSCFVFLLYFPLDQVFVSNNFTNPHSQVLSSSTSSSKSDFLSLPPGRFSTIDARSTIIREYLKKYSSPLEPYAETIVTISDKYSLDYRLLVAIAQQESNLCKKIPFESFNCWGFGIYGDNVVRFSNYSEGLEIVAKTLKHKYVDIGLDTPEKIMAKYTPPSLEKGGPWAKAVAQFMSDLE